MSKERRGSNDSKEQVGNRIRIVPKAGVRKPYVVVPKEQVGNHIRIVPKAGVRKPYVVVPKDGLEYRIRIEPRTGVHKLGSFEQSARSRQIEPEEMPTAAAELKITLHPAGNWHSSQAEEQGRKGFHGPDMPTTEGSS